MTADLSNDPIPGLTGEVGYPGSPGPVGVTGFPGLKGDTHPGLSGEKGQMVSINFACMWLLNSIILCYQKNV